MKVSLNKVFPLPGSVDSAWTQLQNIENVASCMPGAEITEKVDESNYKGKVKVKLGPVTVAFSGTIEVQELDEGNRKLHLIASGQDAKGTSSATMDLTANIEENAETGCQLAGDADVTVNGKLANFGGRMMTQVADQILQQFADNFAARLPQTSGADATAADGDTSAAAAPAGEAVAEPANEINAVKFGWSVIVGFVKSLFGRAT